ncbi:glycosyltransferase family 2 protein [Mangrovimonas sp. DI 80]|uniref:glycosyltransferase n=1 Tax=Mangrovimonas sp. DI 80 TaxID=1779330 RepID=UPI000976FC50|nr:glycosyltransferase [Mangrovimonas sp. DI 80]OMP29781.1 glycosyl transferase family 2 [Mangrovimonas sp. DI 80]
MNTLSFSFVVPVYNRPDEVAELLESFSKLEYHDPFEIVIVEDGSSIDCKAEVKRYGKSLDITYYFKSNSGPGDSRNYGMKRAKGNYFIILDSDCVLPPQYLKEVFAYLQKNYVDCFGGPDTAHLSFTPLQKAINFAMTSFISTGGIRGGKKQVGKFQPRSFNMGISKEAFEASGGFGVIHPGEDPDLSIRLTDLGFQTALIEDAFVYHKRRISWSKFYTQVHKFGLVRPILNSWHPKTSKLTYWFPTLFMLGFVGAVILWLLGYSFGILAYLAYFFIAFLLALFETKSLEVALKSMYAIAIQFFGYGYGFLKSTITLKVLGKTPEAAFPHLFFKHAE